MRKDREMTDTVKNRFYLHSVRDVEDAIVAEIAAVVEEVGRDSAPTAEQKANALATAAGIIAGIEYRRVERAERSTWAERGVTPPEV